MISGSTFNESLSSHLLGLESRSILKSIQTEHTKLTQSPHLTRSDLHYFRARYNYYRLSLLRLPQEERVILEPFLGRFIEQIISAEGREGGNIENPPPPFLQSVTTTAPKLQDKDLVVPPAPIVSGPISQPSSGLKQAISELQLLKLSLSAELTAEAKKTLADSIDRILTNLQK